MLFAVFLTVSLAHVHVLYDTIQMPIRNAPSKTADGTFSTDNGGCGGANTFGSNGISVIQQGASLNLHFNYGTGTNGDHAESDNVFQAAFINLDAGQQQSDMFNKANQIGAAVPAPSGSTPAGYNVQVTIPMQTCNQCVLSVYDQRHWGGCIDLQVVPAGNVTGSKVWPVGWVPTSALAGYSQSLCTSAGYSWEGNYTSATGAEIVGAAFCCPSGAVACGGRCWMGDAPKTEQGVNIFPDGSLCYADTLCNGTLSQAFCSYTFNGQQQRSCKSNCQLCESLCQTSKLAGYTNCVCVGSDASARALTLGALVVALALLLL